MGRFCTDCGTEIYEGEFYCTNCGKKYEVPNGASVVFSDGFSEAVENATPTEGFENSEIKKHSMKWYKFLVYFALIAGSVINLGAAILYITGMIYFSQSDGSVTSAMVYKLFGTPMQILDITYGVLAIISAILGIITWVNLKNYKAKAPALVCLLYTFSLVMSVVYNVGVYFVAGVFQPTTIVSYVFSVLIIALNSIYFKKRKYMFVN